MAVLVQVVENRELIMVCAIRALKIPEQNYSATKRECLSVIWLYIVGSQITIITDHLSF